MQYGTERQRGSQEIIGLLKLLLCHYPHAGWCSHTHTTGNSRSFPLIPLSETDAIIAITLNLTQ